MFINNRVEHPKGEIEQKAFKRLKRVFCFIKEDGTLSDAGIVDELLEHDEIIRKELQRLGIIKRFIVENSDTAVK